MGKSELLVRAESAVSVGLTPVVAWLDGYSSGHTDATNKAVEMIKDDCPFIAGEIPEGLTDCVVCDGLGCEFCPISEGSSGTSADQ